MPSVGLMTFLQGWPDRNGVPGMFHEELGIDGAITVSIGFSWENLFDGTLFAS